MRPDARGEDPPGRFSMDFATRFDPKEAEPRIYKDWESKGFFTADAKSAKKAFTIVIPPPNVTGALHIGHALNSSLQDALVRWKRMSGFEALYLPGTDHAGIATQNVVEKELRKEGKNRHQLGREEFLKRVWAWKEQSGGMILHQLRRLGCSCDWTRTRFTMDEAYSAAIRKVFVELFAKGWIYRGLRPINWCPRCQTALSDLEVKRPEGGSAQGKLWHLRYPVKGRAGVHVTVATTRPETMLGDTAVMVNPKDERWKALVGQSVVLPFLGRELPIIADEAVDPAFGSGAVKVTPAHDVNDFEVGKRHGLKSVIVMDPAGKMNAEAGPFSGLDRFEARKQVVAKLEEQGLLEKVEDHATPIGLCDRCDTILEPYLSEQWFVKMKELAAPAIAAVRQGDVKFHPERWSKVYLDWMENIQDWCVSRQLWWGHRIPVWYCACGATTAAAETPAKCSKCAGTALRQDEDVLDTWFSSALWPFATLGWPAETEDLKKFYPTDVLVTDRGIINLWVARMIMTGLEFRKRNPFRDVIIHATILDDGGQRMSKSKGTGIDPLNLVDQYGADALRFALATLSTGTQDYRFGKGLSAQKTEQARNFITKFWNAARYTAMNSAGAPAGLPAEGLEPEDRWILSRLNRTVKAVTEALGAYEFGRAADTLHSFTWDDFCDWYIECTKRRTSEEAVKRILVHVVATTLRLLHPFCPFVTEELWQRYAGAGLAEAGPLLRKSWPAAEDARIDGALEGRMAVRFQVVKAIREIRARYQIGAGVAIGALASVHEKQLEGALGATDAVQMISHLGNLSSFSARHGLEKPKGWARWTGADVTVFVDIAGKFDAAKEIVRSEKELLALKSTLERNEKQLANAAFVKAKPELAGELQLSLKEARPKIAELEAHVAELKELA